MIIVFVFSSCYLYFLFSDLHIRWLFPCLIILLNFLNFPCKLCLSFQNHLTSVWVTIFWATSPNFHFYVSSPSLLQSPFPFVIFSFCEHSAAYAIFCYELYRHFWLVHLTWDWVWFQYNLCDYRSMLDLQLVLHHKMFLYFLLKFCNEISKLISSKSVHYEHDY